jgi:ribosomal protein S19
MNETRVRVYFGERMFGVVLGLFVQIRRKSSHEKKDMRLLMSKQQLETPEINPGSAKK